MRHRCRCNVAIPPIAPHLLSTTGRRCAALAELAPCPRPRSRRGGCSESALRVDEVWKPDNKPMCTRSARVERKASAKGKVTIYGTINHCWLVGFPGRGRGLCRRIGRASIRRHLDQSGAHHRSSRGFRSRWGNHHPARRDAGIYAHRAHSASFDDAARRGAPGDHRSRVADSRCDPDRIGLSTSLLSLNARSDTCTTASNRIAARSIGRPGAIRTSTWWHDVACHRRHRVDARGHMQRVDSAGRNHPLGECHMLSVLFKCKLNMRSKNVDLRCQRFSPLPMFRQV
jgi:hypothetical protein